MKIKIHPSSIIISILLVLKFGLSAFLSCTLAVFLHELCHAFVSKNRGYINNEIILMPYGAILYNRENYDKLSNVIIAISGPIINFLLSLITISFFWLIPNSFTYLKDFVYANITIGFFNLLPLYPLDGGRVIMALFEYKPKVRKVLKIITIFFAIFLFILYIFSLKDGANYTLLIMGLFLTFSVLFDDENDFAYFLQKSPIIKDYSDGVIERIIYVDKDITLHKILLLIKPQYLCTFVIVDGGKKIKKYSEFEMKEIINSNKLSEKISKFI